MAVAGDGFDGVFLCCPFFPLYVFDEIWDVIKSVSEGFLTYSYFWKIEFVPLVIKLSNKLFIVNTETTVKYEADVMDSIFSLISSSHGKKRSVNSEITELFRD